MNKTTTTGKQPDCSLLQRSECRGVNDMKTQCLLGKTILETASSCMHDVICVTSSLHIIYYMEVAVADSLLHTSPDLI